MHGEPISVIVTEPNDAGLAQIVTRRLTLNSIIFYRNSPSGELMLRGYDETACALVDLPCSAVARMV